MNPSTAQARVIVDELIRNAVAHAVVSPGSRNAPLSLALETAAAAGDLTLHVRIDERSAAFLALGIAARSGQPVVVVCTSGTAAANFHPAVAEADRSGVPLFVLTADRPPELRAAGANQVIEQHGLYGGAVRYFDELAVAEPRVGQNAYWRSQICRAWSIAVRDRWPGPVHVNVPFREPLVPTDDAEWPESLAGREHGHRWSEVRTAATSSSVVPSARRGLVLVCTDDPTAAGEWAEQHHWPLVSEIGGVGAGGEAVLASGGWLLAVEEFLAEHKPEQVVCIGRPSVFRQIQGLLSDPEVDVLLAGSGSDWPAPAHGVRQIGSWPEAPTQPADQAWFTRWRRADAVADAAVRDVLAAEPWPSGVGVAAELVSGLPSGSLLVVGSSNPTRDIALVGGRRPDVRVHRNRGVAGIDGTVSTAIGAAVAHDGPAYALLGDLTFLHDVNGLLLGPAERRVDLTVIVLNDVGGGIFSLLEQGKTVPERSFERVFGTSHDVDLAAVCAGYRIPHTRVETAEEFRTALHPRPGLRVVEVRIERSRRSALHDRLHDAVAAAVSADRAPGTHRGRYARPGE